MMDREDVFDYYTRETILESIVDSSKNREVSAALRSGGYTSRPNIVEYPQDVKKLLKDGAVSFHGSVERWSNPMQIDTKMSSDDFNRLRKGWDLIIDIDSSMGIEAAKITVLKVIGFLESYGIESYGVKFSGRRGFHVGIPWESFPAKVDFERTEKKFPEIPQAVVSYIRNEVESELLESFIDMKGSFHELSKELEGPVESLSPFAFVDIEKDWGRRHLFRLPYSLHEKTWLVSYPMEKEEIESFEMDNAKPENIETGRSFLDEPDKKEAMQLVIDSVNWVNKQKEREKEEIEEKTEKIEPDEPIPEKRFPPCVKLILEGLPDGRKRSVFILITFLRNMKWDWDRIEEKLKEWNDDNKPPLSENYINTQIKWFKRQDRELLSPSCDHDLYYTSFGVCKPDEICKDGTEEIQIKNPVVYPFKKKGDS